jgi:hypothetical protein
MAKSSYQIESQNNVIRINNGPGYNLVNFQQLEYVKTHIVPGILTTIPNMTPSPGDVLSANEDLTTFLETYCTSNFAYGSDWATTTRYICYESNRDVMNAAGIAANYVHAQVDIYRIVQIPLNNKA